MLNLKIGDHEIKLQGLGEHCLHQAPQILEEMMQLCS